MLKQLAYISMVLTVISLICIDNAYAYIDPGTGSMILQALLAGGVAVLAFWRQIKTYCSTLLSGKSGGSAKSDDPE